MSGAGQSGHPDANAVEFEFGPEPDSALDRYDAMRCVLSDQRYRQPSFVDLIVSLVRQTDRRIF